jgi:hypothetical protein
VQVGTLAFDPDAYLNEGKNPSGFDPDAYLGIAPAQVPFTDKLKQAAIDSVKRIASSSAEGAKQVATMSPQVQKMTANAAPVLGGIAGMPFGLGAPGAAAGEFVKNAANTVLDPASVPKTPLGNFASTVGAGVAQEPKILGAIPGVSQVGEMAGNLAGKIAGKVGTGAAKFAEALTGAKANVLEQGARQGLSTYAAPSLPKAQEIFGQALGPEGQSAVRQGASEAFDPSLGKARALATEIGTKLEQGKPISAIEALQARQATDRVISATPITDKLSRNALYGWRNQFDNELSSQSGPLADASRTYRQAIVKDTLLNPLKITKQGQISQVAPMVATLAASAGAGSGHRRGAGMGGLGYLAASSPALAGLAATTGGSVAQGLNAIAKNPAARQVLYQVLQRLQQGNGTPSQ